MPAEDQLLLTTADLDALLERSKGEGILLFKHSTACPISAAAYRELDRFRRERGAAAPYTALVRVIEERPLSREIEARLRVRHESPQAIWIRAGAAAGHLTHGSITAEALATLAR